jgi:hypothetical protein
MKPAALALALTLASAPGAQAGRPSDQQQKAKAKAVWMTVYVPKSGKEFYLEASQDGKALFREETLNNIVTRRGSIPVPLVKDLVREAETSEAVTARNTRQNRAIFYKGEIVRLSAYISGELTVTEAPLDKFGEAFNYAFGEIRKEVLKLPAETSMAALLRAEPLTGDEYDAFVEKAAVDGEVKNVETSDIQDFRPLMAAIKDANRLIPVETQEEVKGLRAFIDKHRLYGLRTLFYLPSTRGAFKCHVLEAARKGATQPAAAGKTIAAPAKKRPGNRKK